MSFGCNVEHSLDLLSLSMENEQNYSLEGITEEASIESSKHEVLTNLNGSRIPHQVDGTCLGSSRARALCVVFSE